jgi:hypothetical protein
LESIASTDESRAGHFARGLRFLLDDAPIGIDGRALAFEKPTIRIEERAFGFARATFGAVVRLRRRKHALFERQRRNRNRQRDVLRQNGAPGFDSRTSSSTAAVLARQPRFLLDSRGSSSIAAVHLRQRRFFLDGDGSSSTAAVHLRQLRFIFDSCGSSSTAAVHLRQPRFIFDSRGSSSTATHHLRQRCVIDARHLLVLLSVLDAACSSSSSCPCTYSARRARLLFQQPA